MVALGRSGSAAELILKAQAAQAAALQQAVELRRLGGASHILWQLAESAPSSSPALIDAAGRPKAAYYALRRATGPLTILADFGGKAPMALSTQDALAAEVCVRSDAATLRGATVRAEVFDSSMRRLGAWRRSLDVPRGVLARPLALRWRPHPSLVGDVCFLRLRLDDRAGRTLASNLYWFGIVRPPAREAEPRLRVAWLAAKPSGPLADAAFLAAARIEVSRPERPQPEEPESVMQDEEDVPDEEVTGQDWLTPTLPPIALDGYDAIVVDAATVLDEHTEDDLRAVAEAVARGRGLLIVGLNDDLLLSALAPLLPIGEQAELPSGIARRPVAVVPQHPALAGLSLATCPLLPRRPATALRGDAKALAQFDAGHPFLAEMSHGRGRVLALATVPGDRVADWPQIRAF